MSGLSKVVAATLVSALWLGVLACSTRGDTAATSVQRGASERTGSLGLSLQPVNGITLTSVHYTVSNVVPGMVSEGNLPTPGTGTSLGFGIPLPVGGGYYLSLSAVSAETDDDITCTGSYGPFAVLANASTALSLTLVCVDNTKGSVLAVVDTNTDACPRLVVDYVVAEPSVAAVGGEIHVHALAHDLDNPAEKITYAWSIVEPVQAAVGVFTPSNAPDSSFRCSSPRDSVRISVRATNHECGKSLEAVVSCLADLGGCGDGIVALAYGETCDPAVGPGHPADPGCPFDCTKICGDGVAEGDEQCDPVPYDPVHCVPPGQADACHFPSQVCGDGLVAGNEQCDDGGPSRTCSGQCELVVTQACVECEQAGDCFANSDNCLPSVASPFTPAQTALCYDVMQCVQQSGCLAGPLGNLGTCYCGTLSTQPCSQAPFDLTQPGAPNGPCAALIQAGNPTRTTNSSILGALLNRTTPAGRAGMRLNCEKTDPTCAPLCGLQ